MSEWKYYSDKFKEVIILYIGLLILFGLIRSLFIFYNIASFSTLTPLTYFAILFYGIRFDLFSISVLNSLSVLLLILPFTSNQKYRLIGKIIFLSVNGVGFLFELIDVVYFDFIHRRSTIDIFNMVLFGQTDILHLLPHFVFKYWFIVIAFLFSLMYLNWLYTKISNNVKLIYLNPGQFFRQCLFMLSTSSFVIIGIRGGIQKVPIVLLDASKDGLTQFNQAILNTSFCIIKSIEMDQIKPSKYFSNEVAAAHFNPVDIPVQKTFKPYNVFIVILESFSKEYTGLGNRKSYTPFLDSLAKESLVFSNAFANGKSSIEALPSIIASMPSFMQRPYINSQYSNNKIDALPTLLEKRGYSTEFFHGGTNGTMNFNSFASIAGFNKYFGRSEYNDDKDFDGTWGIWDHKFFPKIVDEIDNCKDPFFACLFTLSSHDPFKVPDEFNRIFPVGNTPITEVIGYTDYSLRKLFEKAKLKKWFANTVFIFISDHTSISNDPYYSSIIGQYSIPLIIYNYENKKGIEKKIVQQIDIQPTILDMLNYDLPSYSFGKSVFREEKHRSSIFFTNPNYYIVSDSNINVFDGKTIIESYNYILDSMCRKNLRPSKDSRLKLENNTKALIQTYLYDVSENKTTYEEKHKNAN